MTPVQGPTNVQSKQPKTRLNRTADTSNSDSHSSLFLHRQERYLVRFAPQAKLAQARAGISGFRTLVIPFLGFPMVASLYKSIQLVGSLGWDRLVELRFLTVAARIFSWGPDTGALNRETCVRGFPVCLLC